MFMMNDLLQFFMTDFASIWVMLLGNFIMIAILAPWVAISVVLVIISIYFIVRKIAPVTGELRKLELISKSPGYTLLSQTISGIVTLRAFGYQGWFIERYSRVILNNFRAVFTYQALVKSFMLYADLAVSFLSTVNILVLIILRDEIPLELIVFSLSFTITNSVFVAWGTKQGVDMAFAMASVQRVFHYCSLETEAETQSPTPFDPQTGAIVFDNVSMKYRPHLDYAVADLSLEIADAAKVGIVGRTGAGKSSILQIITRLKEVDKGRVQIDGIDISTLNLHELRKKITIIPQNPMIFSTTVRQNLDPFGDHGETRLWEVLEDV